MTNVNRYREWCLYGVRYYFTSYGVPPFALNSLPKIHRLDFDLTPNLQTTTDWLRPWPYPQLRYWPIRPYGARWFWFRPIPWLQYRYFPPVINFALAQPKDEFGGGFLPTPDDDSTDPSFPILPPSKDSEGRFVHQGGTEPDSFFDIFDVAGECWWRAFEVQQGDRDGDGSTSRSDYPRALLQERAFDPSQDSLDLPAVP
jgi:hypothetical protein